MSGESHSVKKKKDLFRSAQTLRITLQDLGRLDWKK